MPERRVWIAQCLCPQRHCICALAGEADDLQEAHETLTLKLEEAVEDLLVKDKLGNPWCGICGAKRETWKIEVGRTRYKTMAEADEPLRENQARQWLTSLVLGTHGPKRPGNA